MGSTTSSGYGILASQPSLSPCLSGPTGTTIFSLLASPKPVRTGTNVGEGLTFLASPHPAFGHTLSPGSAAAWVPAGRPEGHPRRQQRIPPAVAGRDLLHVLPGGDGEQTGRRSGSAGDQILGTERGDLTSVCSKKRSCDYGLMLRMDEDDKLVHSLEVLVPSCSRRVARAGSRIQPFLSLFQFYV